jgi:hypothetical protein
MKTIDVYDGFETDDALEAGTVNVHFDRPVNSIELYKNHIGIWADTMRFSAGFDLSKSDKGSLTLNFPCPPPDPIQNQPKPCVCEYSTIRPSPKTGKVRGRCIACGGVYELEAVK